jgi:neurotrimin
VSGDYKTTFNLHISDVQEDDRGQYMCQINTDPMMFQLATLDVMVPPDIDSKRTSGDIEAKLGSNVKIACNADGYPKPRIRWIREDKKKIKIQDKATGRMRACKYNFGAI